MARKLNENIHDDSDNTDKDDSDGDSLKVYDGFAGGFQLSQATSVTEVKVLFGTIKLSTNIKYFRKFIRESFICIIL